MQPQSREVESERALLEKSILDLDRRPDLEDRTDDIIEGKHPDLMAQLTDNIESAAKGLHRKLTGPEATLFLRDIWYTSLMGRGRITPVGVDTKELSKVDNLMDVDFNSLSTTEDIFGTVLMRDEEDPYSWTMYKVCIDEYHSLDIKKFFGYTFKEYMELTLWEVDNLREKAIKMKEKLIEAMKEMESENKSMGNLGGIPSDDDMDEIGLG